MKRYYLAYGSNLNVPQMKMRCPTSRLVGKATIHGYCLLFRGSKTGSYLTIEPSKRGKVPVVVWEVTPSDERALDRYEGFPRFYYKKDFEVTLDAPVGEKKVEAFAYIMHEDRPLGLPTDFYMEVCADGYEDFGFDKKYLYRAVQRSRKAIARADARRLAKMAAETTTTAKTFTGKENENEYEYLPFV